MRKSSELVPILALVAVVVLAAGCIQPPNSSGSSSGGAAQTGSSPSGGGSPAGVAAVETTGASQAGVTDKILNSSSNTTTYLTPVTPYQTATTTILHAPTLPPESTTNETYLELYNATLPFMYNTVAYAYNLTDPPLYIDFLVKPKIVTDKKAYTSRSGSKEEAEVTTTYASPSAWFEVTVRDRESGAILLQDGYGKTYGNSVSKEVLVRKSGDLQFDFRGNEANVTITLKVKQQLQ